VSVKWCIADGCTSSCIVCACHNDLLRDTPGHTCVYVAAGAQCAHAAVGVIGAYKSGNEALFRQWERHGQPKIALKIKDDQEMVSSPMNPCSLHCQVLHRGTTQQ
jgi:hypothetical protein